MRPTTRATLKEAFGLSVAILLFTGGIVVILELFR